MFFIKHPRTDQMRLVYIQADPWKVIDVDQQFNLPETICVVKGDIGHQPS